MMKRIFKIRMIFALAMLALFVTGCLGPQVLQERTEHVPAPDPQVELRLAAGKPADVLILYNDQNPKTLQVKRRAFYLFANYERVMHGQRPKFVSPERGKTLVKIPAFQKQSTNGPATNGDLYAIFASPRDFTLLSRDKEIAEFGLPEFGDWLTVRKLLLFPGAVAADAVGLPAIGIANHPEVAAEVALQAARVAAEAAARGSGH